MTMRDADDTAPARGPQLTTADRPIPIPLTSAMRRSPGFLKLGTCFGRYRVVRLIGEGGMSEVYEATHIDLKKGFALKVLKPELALDPAARARFVIEGENAARIRHPNVVDVTDVGVAQDLPYLVMTLLEGECLSVLFARQGAVPFRELVDLLLPVASAVAKGHEQGIVHRDLKPDNILLHREGRRVVPKVLDFGISISLRARRSTRESRIAGTPAYMSPEQVLGDSPDVCTDQYAFGVILYEGLTGHLPRDSTDPADMLHSVAYQSFRPPSDHIALPEGLEAVILRAMTRNPSQRFPSMRDLAIALVPFASDAAHDYWSTEFALEPEPRSEAFRVPPPYVPRESFAHPRRRPWARRLGWAASALALVGAAMFVSRLQEPTPARNAGWRSASAASSATGAFEIDVRATPDSAALILDGSDVGVGRYRGQLPSDGAFHELRVTADGFAPHSVRFRNGPPPNRVELVPLTPARMVVTSPAVVPSKAVGDVQPRPHDKGEPQSANAMPAPSASRPGPNAPISAPIPALRRPTSSTPVASVTPAPISSPLTASAPAAAPASSSSPAEPATTGFQPEVRIINEREPRVRIIE